MKVGLRIPSWSKTIGAWKSQWKRSWRRLFVPGYGTRGAGWFTNPKKAAYNWWYRRTTFSVKDLFLPVRAIFKTKKKYRKRSKVNKGTAGHNKTIFHIFWLLSGIVLLPFALADRVVSAAQKATTGFSRRDKSSSSYTRAKNYNKTAVKNETAYNSKKVNPLKVNTTTVSQTKQLPSTKNVYDSPENTFTEAAMKPQDFNSVYEKKVYSDPGVVKSEVSVNEPDEFVPKSKPQNEYDQCVRSRYYIAGAFYCDKTIVSRLKVGDCFDFVAEPNNEYDKNAIMLILNGNKIGYVAKKDNLIFTTSLRLNRKMYGVITDIYEVNNITRYEYEAWYDNSY